MALRGYILIDTAVGSARSVTEAVQQLAHAGARLMAADTVTGPYDVIVHFEALDLDQLGRYISSGIQKIPGVKRTTTCLAIS